MDRKSCTPLITVNGGLTILYGSETGTAQDVAEEIWKSAKRQGFKTTVSSMDDYDIRKLTSEKLIVFVVATTGQGDPPANMKKFWTSLLRKNLSPTMLSNLTYGVLGLGDSSYAKYNFAAKKLNKRLTQLGATQLLPIGLADDQHDLGIDAVVDSWAREVWQRIINVFDIPVTKLADESTEVIEKYNVSVLNAGHKDSMDGSGIFSDDIYEAEARTKDVYFSTVIRNERTTAEDHFQDVRLIKFQASNLVYEPGDVLYVRPKNSAKQIEKFFHVLHDNNVHLYPDTRIDVSEKEIKVPAVLTNKLYLQEVVEQYWDLSFKPRRSTMRILSFISDNELEKEKLCEFASPSGQEELYDYVNRPRRNIVEVLADFPHTTSKLNVKLLFEVMPPIKPRAFSIASSLKRTPNEVHILVAVVKYKTKLLEPRYGLCSNWLASLKCNDRVTLWIQKGTFNFSFDKPMILIGPGTGVAPFRSLLLEKEALGDNLDDCVLFFGCRKKNKDYHCQNDFERLRRSDNLHLFCAFSRDQEDKIYVQHVIRYNGQLCWDFLSHNGSIYLAGNSKNMPNGVRDEIVALCKRFGNLKAEEAEFFVKNLEKNNRYQTETWA